MGESEVKSAALWLGKLLAEEINYLSSVGGKVERLRTELSALAAFLTDVAVKSHRQNNLVQTAISEARNIAYDCQDVIEKYILEVACHGYEEYEGFHLCSIMRWVCLLGKAVSVHKIGSKIDELNERISALKSTLISYGVSDRINNYTSETNSVNHHTERLRRVYSHEREEHVVVGLESQLEELVEKLVKTDHVIAISGMGGIGKSTLARELYHHPKLRRGDYFKAFGWVTTSQQFQLDRVLRTLMYCLVPKNDHVRRSKVDEDIKAEQAHEALYDLMREFNCLVVIDDIWTAEDWSRLKAAFPRKIATGSRIVLTTRNEEMISGLDHQVHLHPIKVLDKNTSWELFEKTTFTGATCTDSTKEELGREMLRHCNGVPLAIVVLAKVLKRKERVEDWKQMQIDISLQIQRGSAPNFPFKEVYDVLQVSYDELPFHLKHCFLHLANFPKGYNIPTDKLYQLWVGEGIILKEDSNELEEDIAERYLEELVSRNMVQVSRRHIEETERIRKCRIHDLMRDVCIRMAKREGSLQVINCRRPMLLTNDKNADHLLMTLIPERDKRLRRLAVYMSDQESSTPTTTTISTSVNVSRAPNLRSLLLFSVNEQRDDEDCKRLMETIFEDYRLLRVFNCQDLHIKGKLPKKVGNLIQLRYLGLGNTRVTKLPSSIERLQWLQTLDLRVDHTVVLSLPNILWKMKQLRHVYLPYYGGLVSVEKEGIAGAPQRYLIKGGGFLQLEGLWNLQTLMYIDLDRVDPNGLSELRRLKTLWAACETNKKALYPFLQCSSMKGFSLKLHARIINEDRMILSSCKAMHHLHVHANPSADFHLRQPLSLEMLPKSLVCVGIWYLQLDDDPLPVLEKLPNLVNLSLNMCYSSKKMVCSKSGFPKLIDLWFQGLLSFSHWEVEQGTLQKLENLTILSCPVKNIPDALPSSVNVRIHGAGESAALTTLARPGNW